MGLTARFVKTADVGWHGDGRGLYFQVTQNRPSWVYRYSFRGKERYMGLGSCLDITLEEARDAALAARKLKISGVDPLEHKRAKQSSIELEAASAMTFRQAAEAYIVAHSAGWKGVW